jgi:hypothetical protein
VIFAFPVVEFVDVSDRLPYLHPGLLASAIFVAVLVFMVVMAYRCTAPPI